MSPMQTNRQCVENLDQWTMAQRLETVVDYSSSEKIATHDICQNCRTISLVCHTSKFVLRAILNMLVNRAEQISAEEQASFRSHR